MFDTLSTGATVKDAYEPPSSRLGSIAAAWLVCQTATLGLAPAMMVWAGIGAADLVECTCGHGADATCPMHHHTMPTGARPCVMQSTSDHAIAVLASVLGILAFLPQETPGVTLVSAERTIFSDMLVGLDRLAPPDPPPPRA